MCKPVSAKKKPPHQLPDETARLVVFRSVRFDLYLIFRGAYRQMEVVPDH